MFEKRTVQQITDEVMSRVRQLRARGFKTNPLSLISGVLSKYGNPFDDKLIQREINKRRSCVIPKKARLEFARKAHQKLV